MDTVLRQLSSMPRLALWLLLFTMAAASTAVLVQADTGAGWAIICRPLGDAARWHEYFIMWGAMSLAMMLPTAAPMISTYLDIAEAARAKSAAIVPAALLAGGYAAVWLVFSAIAAAIQWAAAGSDLARSQNLSGLIFLAAGAYQFAPLKHACLAKCRRPMQFFLANWRANRAGVFAMGLSQGALCLGCCWALMGLGFAAGFMNILWMSGLALIMVLEKTLPEPKPVIYGLGIGLIGAGLAMVTGAAV